MVFPTTSSDRNLWSWMVLGVSIGAGYCGLEFVLSYLARNATLRTRRQRCRQHQALVDRVSKVTSRFQASLREVCGGAHEVHLFWWTLPLVSVQFWKTYGQNVVVGAFVTTVQHTEEDVDMNNGSSTVTTSTRHSSNVTAGNSAHQDPLANNDIKLRQPQSPPKAWKRQQQQQQQQQQPLSEAQQPQPAPQPKGRYLEIMVHNISHTDLILGLEVVSSSSRQPTPKPLLDSATTAVTVTTTTAARKAATAAYFLESLCLCRPRFSAFDMYCRKVLASLQQQQQSANHDKISNKLPADIIMVPQHRRSEFDPRYILQPDAVLGNRPHVSVGFHFHASHDQQHKNDMNTTAETPTSSHSKNTTKTTLPSFDQDGNRTMTVTQALADLRVRGKDMAKLVRPQGEPTNETLDGEPSSPGSSWNVVPPQETIHKVLCTASDVLPEECPPIARDQETLVQLNAVFFPLLAALLPRWNAQIAHKYNSIMPSSSSSSPIKKVLVLVTGVGTPRNWTHSMWGNSTEVLADLMELFLARVYPDITVVKVHSDLNIFRYDDNITFVQQELLPCVNAYRDAHATGAPYPDETMATEPSRQSSSAAATAAAVVGLEVSPRAYISHDARNRRLSCSNVNFHNKQYQQQQLPSFPFFDVHWKKSFSLTVSFADGSPARTHAIQTALRVFRPMYFHIWQLKTFWHERKIVDDDVEVHSFEEMETEPALESSVLRGGLQQVVEEMKAFRQEMVDTLMQPPVNIDGCITCGHDINTFWLRKTHKPVLAVLLVQSPGQKPVLYRGTNMEVSMPTGSLCAERNVIGTALASNPSLKRQDLKCIAVLAVPLQQPQTQDGPSSVASGERRSSRHRSFDDVAPRHQRRRSSIDEREEEDWMVSYAEAASSAGDDDTSSGSQHETATKGTPLRQIALFRDSSNSLVDMLQRHHDESKKSPLARPSMVGAKEKRTVIVRSNNNDVDLNPLRPCGACHEWLKKIAECNPYFQIVTFTDAECNGVYVTLCQE